MSNIQLHIAVWAAVSLAAPPVWGRELPQALRTGPKASQSAASWHALPTDPYKGKRDDIVFATSAVGYYGTGKGDLFKTIDGGASWTKQWSKPGTFIRALGFIDADHGFLGNVGDAYPNVTDTNALYRTTDGGRSWSPIAIPGGAIAGICAIDVLRARSIHQGRLINRAVIHAAGRVGGPAIVLRSTDGGQNWTRIDLSRQAGMILDVKFVDPNTGFVFAGTDSDISKSSALILKTSDGGKSWREVYRSARKLENSWKGAMVDRRTGFATVQSYDPARATQLVVKTVDGGNKWKELALTNDAKARQFGIGFATRDRGWVGTAIGGFETRDGGSSWKPVAIAPAANKIRTHASDGTPMVYAIGTQVQRLDVVGTRR